MQFLVLMFILLTKLDCLTQETIAVLSQRPMASVDPALKGVLTLRIPQNVALDANTCRGKPLRHSCRLKSSTRMFQKDLVEKTYSTSSQFADKMYFFRQ